jgi:hypothetical protein
LKYETAGIVKVGDNFVLDKKYKQPKPFMIYYGMLQYSGLADYSVYSILVAADNTADQVALARACGTKIFQYIPFGSRFNTEDFLSQIKSMISSYATNHLADGIFLDECEIGYWGNYYENEEMASIFEKGLKEVCEYCRGLGIETLVNGVSAYSDYGDYFLWESFSGYWSTNKINWNATGTGKRIVNADSTIEYTYPYKDWTMTGSLKIENNAVVDGTEGIMSITLDMNNLIRTEERQETYPWVYFEWFGSGADDNTLEIYAYTGNSWPYSPNTWEELPKLWKGEPASWNGINKDTRYLRLELRFKGATSLRMERCFIAYDYVYPYYDMTASNGVADTNHRYWNYNMAQCEYLWQKKSKVICHCYGTPKDTQRMMYTFATYKTFGFEAWDYTHPLHQTIRYTDILDDPFGAFLSRKQTSSGVYEAMFTGCDSRIDVKNSTYSLNRNEPEYWFKRGISSFEDIDKVYHNPLAFTHHTFIIQAEIAVGKKIPGIADGWYVINVIDPIYQYDTDGNVMEDDYFYTVQYYPILSSDLNIRKVWVTDDIFYFYFGMKFQGKVDFLADKPNRYYIYIGTTELDYGFKGEWYDSSFKAQFMIYNQSLFKWDKNAEDERDYTNFRYIGNAFLNYELTEDGTMLTYTLKKSVMGEVSKLNMCFYFVMEETAHNYVALIPSTGVDISVDPVKFPNKVSYRQKRYDLYSPHGYYLSEEIKFKTPIKGAVVQCMGTKDTATSIHLFVRVKQKEHKDFDDFEKANGLTFYSDKTITHLQYAVALNTTDGKKTPSFQDVRITPGSEIEPEEYTEKTAEIHVGISTSTKISYEHGERKEPSYYKQTASFYFAPAITEVINFEH